MEIYLLLVWKFDQSPVTDSEDNLHQWIVRDEIDSRRCGVPGCTYTDPIATTKNNFSNGKSHINKYHTHLIAYDQLRVKPVESCGVG